MTTLRVNDDNPCDVCVVDSKPIIADVVADGEFHSVQFGANGIVVGQVRDRSDSANNSLTPSVLKPVDKCEPRLVVAKPLSNQTPSKHCELIVQKAEVACDNTFCAPKNPVQLIADADPSGSYKNCRALQRPAGSHLPCATLQVDGKNIQSVFATAPNPPVSDVIFERGCRNDFGCEYAVAYVDSNDETRYGTFVIDNQGALKNGDGSGFNPAFFETLGNAAVPVDIICFDQRLYLLTSSPVPAGNLVIEFGNSANNVEMPVETPIPGQPFVQTYNTCITSDKNRKVLIVGNSAGKIRKVSVPTLQIDASFTLDVFMFVGDIETNGKYFIAVGKPDNTAPFLDQLQSYVMTDSTFDFLGVRNGPTSSFRSRQDVQAGITAHPYCENVFYVSGTRQSQQNFIVTCVTLQGVGSTIGTPINSSTEVASVPGKVDAQLSANTSGTAFQRLRPRFCDGIMQFLVPNTSKQGLMSFIAFTDTTSASSVTYSSASDQFEFIAAIGGPNGILCIDNYCEPAILSFRWSFDNNGGFGNARLLDDTNNDIVPQLTASTPGFAYVSVELSEQKFGDRICFNVAAGNNGATLLIEDMRINGVSITTLLPDGELEFNDVKSAPSPGCDQNVLVTECVDDNNPCSLTNVSRNALPLQNEAIAGLTYPFLETAPGGRLLVSSVNSLIVFSPDPSHRRIVNKKPFHTQTPSDTCKLILQNAESAKGPDFCPPASPYVTVYNQNCDPAKNCRAVARPAGTHLPCATLDVANSPSYVRMDLFLDDASDTNTFRSLPNRFGCELIATFQDPVSGEYKLFRFVIDQNCNLLDAESGLPISAPSATVETVTDNTAVMIDIQCFNNNLFVLTSTTLIVKATASDSGVPVPVVPVGDPTPQALCFAVQNINGYYAYVGNRSTKDIHVIDLVNFAPVGSFSLDQAFVGELFVSDIVICGTFLLAAVTNADSTDRDAVYRFDISDNPVTPRFVDKAFLQQSSAGGVRNPAFSFFPGMVHHPTEKTIYVAGGSLPNIDTLYNLNVLTYKDGILRTVNRLQYDLGILFTTSTRRARLNYENGIIQFSIPTPSQCRLISVRVDDDNPQQIETIGNSPVPDPDVNQCYDRLTTTPFGIMVFTGPSAYLGIFKPSAAGRRHVNNKAMLSQNPTDHCLTVVKKAIASQPSQRQVRKVNAYDTVFEQSCDPQIDCNAVTRLAGTHFPCNSVQLNSSPTLTESELIDTSVFTNIRNLTTWPLGQGVFGFEVAFTWDDGSTAYINRVAFDNLGSAFNPATGAPLAGNPNNLQPVIASANALETTDVFRHDGKVYQVCLNRFIINVFSNPRTVTVGPSTNRLLAGAVQNKIGHVAYLTTRVSSLIYTVDLENNDAVNSFVLLGSANNTFGTDILICDDLLFVAQVNFLAAPTDAVTTYSIRRDALTPRYVETRTVNTDGAGGSTTPAATLFPALTHHPVANIVYVSGIDQVGGALMSIHSLTHNNKGNFVGSNNLLSTDVSFPYTQIVNRRQRLNLQDDTLQYLTRATPGSSICVLNTRRLREDQSAFIDEGSRNFLPFLLTQDCYASLTSLSNGLIILTTDDATDELYVFQPTPSGSRYLNDKPMNLPSFVGAHFIKGDGVEFFRSNQANQNEIQPGSQSALFVRLETTLISNWNVIGQQDPVKNVSAIFTPNKRMLIDVTISIRGELDFAPPNAISLQTNYSSPSGSADLQLDRFITDAAPPFTATVEYTRTLIVDPNQPLNFVVRNTGAGQPTFSFDLPGHLSIRFLRYL